MVPHSIHVDIVGLLIDKGADAYAEDKNGRTPLGPATKAGHGTVVEPTRKHLNQKV